MPLGKKLDVSVIPPLAELSLQRTFQVQPLICVTITEQASKMPCYVLELQRLRVMPVWECRPGGHLKRWTGLNGEKLGLHLLSEQRGAAARAWRRTNELIRLGPRELRRDCAHASTSAWK